MLGILILSGLAIMLVCLVKYDMHEEKLCYYCSYYDVLDNPYCKDCKRYKYSRVYINSKIDSDEKRYGGKSHYKSKEEGML